ncbi:hypothetical protein LCGC14_0294750 [marine sediment metagenome]|uniref:HhH-GPD domain-containing protein n=1 Tax=marine sediment metagenome TaxID=412755 RepID=A0A0F9U933_9ZZZZ
MALQLGFEGAVKLQGRDSIPEALDRTLAKYRGYVEDMANPITEDVVFWRIVFAILSVHTAFEANELAYQRLHNNGRLPVRWRTLTDWLARVKAGGSVVQFAGQKARFLLDFQTDWKRDAYPFMPNGDGSIGWRDRLMTIRGLARTKASFAVCLANPLESEVLCIDRHMARLLLGFAPKDIKRVDYERCENELLALAKGFDAPPFAVQWCLWDAQRGHVEPHTALREK